MKQVASRQRRVGSGRCVGFSGEVGLVEGRINRLDDVKILPTLLRPAVNEPAAFHAPGNCAIGAAGSCRAKDGVTGKISFSVAVQWSATACGLAVAVSPLGRLGATNVSGDFSNPLTGIRRHWRVGSPCGKTTGRWPQRSCSRPQCPSISCSNGCGCRSRCCLHTRRTSAAPRRRRHPIAAPCRPRRSSSRLCPMFFHCGQRER